jgi:uncharacterized membrane protein YcaP (DUF421 family)
MFFDSWSDIIRVLTVGSLAYVALVAMLRFSGKRTLSKLNVFDLVVTVAFGSILATIALSKDVALLEGAAAIVLLTVAQYVVSSASTRWAAVRKIVKAVPVVVLCEGRMETDALRRERLTPEEVRQAIRAAGTGSLEDVAAVVLETDGSLSVIAQSALGSGSSLADVGGSLPVGDP